jgi:predicted  nucleic acid-binding Zn-ribbon protein
MARKAQVDVYLNGEQAVAELKRISNELDELNAIKKKNLADGKSVTAVNKEIRKLENEAARVKKQVVDVDQVLRNLSSTSINELNTALRSANGELTRMKRNDPGFADQQKEVAALKNELDIANGRIKQHQSGLTRLADGFNKYFAMATTFMATITGVVVSFKKLSEMVAHLDDIYSDVMKTTQLTRDEVVKLNEEFKKMDTRTSRENLNKLASEAGKLGIEGKKNILDFVDAGNQINVALGEDLGEDAIVNIGKMVGVFEKASSELNGLSLKEKMLAVGSAINDIGASSSQANPTLLTSLHAWAVLQSKQA